MTQQALNMLITGAGSGLGRGMSQYFAQRGHRLYLTDVNLKGIQETIATLGPAAERASAHVVDVTSATQIGDFLGTVRDQRVDVLVNNAGLQYVSPIAEFPQEKWDLVIDVLLKGTFLLTKAVIPRMREAQFGRIVNIGSIHSLVGSPFKSAYVAAKHALVGFSKVVALETADVDITINTICPAYIRTPLVDAQIQAQARAHGISEQEVIEKIMLEPMPKKRFITTEEVAAATEFLMSGAARNITGQTLVIDGGWTAH